jgi:hypothetical protein
LQVAEADLAQGLQATASAEAQLACAADPWSVEPWLLLARVNPGVIRSVDVARWSPGQPTVQERVGSLLQTVFGLKDCDEGFVAQVLSRNSRSSRNCEWLADIGFPTLDNAARKRLYTRAVELSPSRATLHAKLAWQQFLAHEITSKNQDGPEGDWQLARREAERALSLDALNPHKEQKLARRYFPPTMQTGNALLDTQFPSNRPVEELMQQLLAGTQETKPASAP